MRGGRDKNKGNVDFSIRHDGLDLRGELEALDVPVASLITEDAGLLIRLRSRSTSRSNLEAS